MKLSGHCLCGAVAFAGEGDGHFHACCCEMCLRWGGAPALGAPLALTSMTGEESLAAFPSSDWGERVFCRACGSHVFWRMRDGSQVFAFLGALDQKDALVLSQEIFIDHAPQSVRLAGDHPRLTEADYLRSIGAAAPDDART